MKTTKLFLAALTVNYLTKYAQAQPWTEGTCNLWQVCANHADMEAGSFPDTPCANGADVSLPQFVMDGDKGGYTPQVMNSLGASNMKTACPFYPSDQPLCCNSDTAQIMGK